MHTGKIPPEQSQLPYLLLIGEAFQFFHHLGGQVSLVSGGGKNWTQNTRYSLTSAVEREMFNSLDPLVILCLIKLIRSLAFLTARACC